MANRRAAVLLAIVFFLLFFPQETQQPAFGKPFEPDQILARENAALDVLETSRYGDLDPEKARWLNLTGLREHDRFAWELLEGVREVAKEQRRYLLSEDVGNRSLEGPVGELLPLYKNVSGTVRGNWVRSRFGESYASPHANLSAIEPGSSYATRPYHRNITGTYGEVNVWFTEKDHFETGSNDSIRVVRADLDITDEKNTGEGWKMRMHGVHYLDTGSIVVSTTSEKFEGIFALPHFALSNYTFLTAKELLNRTLHEAVKHQREEEHFPINPWSSASDGTSEGIFLVPHCEVIAYFQQSPNWSPAFVGKDGHNQKVLSDIESELRNPQGQDHPAAPPLSMSMVLFSPDCGFVLQSKGPPKFTPKEWNHLTGMKIETVYSRGRNHALLLAIIVTAQVYLMIEQMKYATTPSTRSRISFYTIAMLSLGDGFTGMALLPAAMVLDGFYLPFLTVGFIAFMGASFFDVKFLLDISTIQAEERSRLQRQQHPPASSNRTSTSASPQPQPAAPVPPAPVVPIVNAAGADTLPLPVTAPRPDMSGAAAVFIPSDQDIDAENETTAPTTTTGGPTPRDPTAELKDLYIKFYFTLFVTFIISIWATSWPATLRSVFTNAMIFLYLSAWIPQIHRNVMRNCRKALLWKFAVGQSLLRLVPVAYFYCLKDNILFVEPDRRAFLVLAAWVWLQLWVLGVQEVLGPRVFVKEGWAPPAYEYHPVLRDDVEEGVMPIGFTSSTSLADEEARGDGGNTSFSSSSKGKDKGKRIFDCAICMQQLEVPVLSSSSSSGSADAGTESTATGLGTGLLARRQYMVTPCRHIFHTACLEGAMRYRLQCPICRETLPPL
ncbi:hypothetical protein K402DRAFT_396919 [Aulographum hederae CBS 113979]|uniref:DSC E3 ubiquitin ligase complex subunit A n=1 Tax=Aulographum hederae CBS 113979 TaxID=1176131 RepID=A0A6G1GQG8_9PEZI|nr:hypothetical protein K402DRAFT_396919 [Aulographum hederae CBS 113979]